MTVTVTVARCSPLSALLENTPIRYVPGATSAPRATLNVLVGAGSKELDEGKISSGPYIWPMNTPPIEAPLLARAVMYAAGLNWSDLEIVMKLDDKIKLPI